LSLRARGADRAIERPGRPDRYFPEIYSDRVLIFLGTQRWQAVVAAGIAFDAFSGSHTV
jgi:hypothetical protein